MSSLTYYKMMTVGQKLRKNIGVAKNICSHKPKSQECKVAWDLVEEYCVAYDSCQVKHLIELENEVVIELPWEEESRFYDV